MSGGTARDEGDDNMDRRNGPPQWQQWHDWTVRTHDGAEVGAVVGRFDGGLHEGRLRVQRLDPGGTAVFAVPLSAIACFP